MKSELIFRKAKECDCSDLTILCDAATRGLTSYLWGRSSVVGECRFDVGRTMILTEKDKSIYFENWRIAECNGIVVGAFNIHRLPPVEEADAVTSDILRPLGELKAVAHGTQYISAIAIFPEFRRNGFAFLLLKEAEKVASESQDKRLTLMVGSFNAGAIKLYEKFGFNEWDRREFVPFENSDPGGDWLLMHKDLG